MAKYILRFLPVVAVRWTGDNIDQIEQVSNQESLIPHDEGHVTLEIKIAFQSVFVDVPIGWWVINDGFDIYIKSDDAFAELYFPPPKYKSEISIEDRIGKYFHDQWREWFDNLLKRGNYKNSLQEDRYTWSMERGDYWEHKNNAQTEYESLSHDVKRAAKKHAEEVLWILRQYGIETPERSSEKEKHETTD